MSRPTEVGELDVIIGSQQNVFRLQITVNDIIQVAIVESVSDLIRVFGCFILLEAAVLRLFQMTVEFTFACELKSDVNLALIVEPCEETENVWMPEKSTAIKSNSS